MTRPILTALWFVAALGGGAAAKTDDTSTPPDQAPDWKTSKGVFCAVLDQALAAAAKPEMFNSVLVNLASHPDRSSLTIPGFEAGDCSARHDNLYCTRPEPPAELTLENLTADTARCLGVQPAEEEGFQVFDMGKVAIQIESDCTGCQSGHRVNYRIEVDQAPSPRD